MKSRFVLLSLLIAGILAGCNPSTPAAPYTLRPDDPVQLVFAPNVEQPYVVTRSGDLFEPAAAGWTRMALDTPVNDVLIEYNGVMYAGTDAGLLRYEDNTWAVVPGVPPTDDVEDMHGFLFAMGADGVARSGEGSIQPEDWRMLKMPLPDVPARGLVMLGDHSHVMNNGSLVQTNDMGLSWTIVPPPGEVQSMATDALANLLVVVEDGVYRWQYADKTWSKIAPLPENQPVNRLILFDAELYALAAGRLFRLEKGNWTSVTIEGVGYLTTLAVHRQSRLWVADAANGLLWYTDNAIEWMSVLFVQG